MLKACTVCGTPSQGSRCAKHDGTHTGWSPDRDQAAQGRLRRALLKRAGHRCEAHTGGMRCTATTDLRACHLTSVRDGGGYELSNAALLCGAHDRATDRYAK